MKSRNSASVRVAVAAVLSCPFAAFAQTEPPPPPPPAEPPQEIVGLEDIVVTAQKRQQSLQDVPLSVSAFSGDMLKDGRMLDVRAIVGFTPGFSGNTEDGFTDALSMRGISTNDFGIGGDPSVAMFVDGFWAGRTGGVMTAMYDIERTEVVKGPQGTLFGRNSIAGAVSVITRKPEPEYGASAELTLADWDHVEANAMVNVPLGDQWALRVAGYHLDNKGFLKNDQGGDKLGFHQIAKFNYFPGWHQQSSVSELLINRQEWEKLSEQNKTLIRIALGDSVLHTYAETEAKQFEVMAELRAKQGVQIKRWPDDVLKAFEKAWLEVLKEESAKDPLFKKVADSYLGFREKYRIWGEAQELKATYQK